MIYQCEIDDVLIRDAQIEDSQAILDLIKAIAKYEKMESQVTATKESIEESIFIKQHARVILVEYTGKIIGYMLYFFNYSTFTGGANLYLEDLFLLEEYRHLGIGKALFRILAQIALEQKAKRIDWVCLNWNEPSLKFYKRINAKAISEWVLHRLEGEDIAKLANEETI